MGYCSAFPRMAKRKMGIDEMRINENYFMLHKMILATLAAVCAVSAIAIESNADVRGWFEENWFGKAPLERPTDETFGETNDASAALAPISANSARA